MQINIITREDRELQVFDPCYRYTMPALETSIQGRNKRTVLLNLFDIAEALGRITDEIIKYLSSRIGTSSTPCSIKGEHSTHTLQELLQDYIETYVICGVCKVPETYYKVKSHRIYLKCTACGGKTIVPETSVLEKTNHFIKKAYRSRPRANTVVGHSTRGIVSHGTVVVQSSLADDLFGTGVATELETR